MSSDSGLTLAPESEPADKHPAILPGGQDGIKDQDREEIDVEAIGPGGEEKIAVELTHEERMYARFR